MKIWYVLLVCGCLMTFALSQSLWLDEAISANVAKNFSYSEIVTKFSINDFHPPLYYLSLKAWGSIFGYSEIGIRSMSVFFALITVYIVYKMAGINAAILTGVNPLFVYYSNEARMYIMVTMLLTLTLYFFIRKKYLLVNIFAFLSFVTFYGSIFLLAAMGLYLLLNKRYKELFISNIGIIMAILVVSPLLSQQLQNSKEMLSTVKNWSLVLGKANVKNLLLIPMKFSSGRISFEPKFVYYLISGSFALVVFSKLFKKNVYSFLFWTTLIVGTIFSMFTPMLQYFRFLYLIPIMAIVIKQSKIVAVGFFCFSLFYVLNQNTWREDWKLLTKNIEPKVYMISSFYDPIKYYRSDVEVGDIRGKISEKEIVSIPYGEEIHGVDHKVILRNAGYKLIRVDNFRGLTKEYWHLGT